MNINQLGPTQKQLYEIIQSHPGSSLNEIVQIAKEQDITIPSNRSTLNSTLRILRERSVIYSISDPAQKNALLYYPEEMI